MELIPNAPVGRAGCALPTPSSLGLHLKQGKYTSSSAWQKERGRASIWYLKQALGKTWTFCRPAMYTRSYVHMVLQCAGPAAPSSAVLSRSRGRPATKASQKAPKSLNAAGPKRASAVATSSKPLLSPLKGASSGKRVATASPPEQNPKQRTKNAFSSPLEVGGGASTKALANADTSTVKTASKVLAPASSEASLSARSAATVSATNSNSVEPGENAVSP